MESEIQKLSDAELLRILNPALAVAVGDYGVPELFGVLPDFCIRVPDDSGCNHSGNSQKEEIFCTR